MAVAVADVSGKGAGASLLMASVRAWLRARAGSGSPAEVVASLNQFVLESTQLNKYVTLFYAELDPAARTLKYVNAGHVPPFVMNSEGGRSRLEEGGPVLGVIEGVVFEEGKVELKRGDLLAVVTDGVTEAEDSEGTQFGEPRVFDETGHSAGLSADEALSSLRQAVERWVGPVGCSDDLTLLMLKAP
jgi:sigma-B regulation protein RsbU (phosphoserine phosphatase)